MLDFPPVFQMLKALSARVETSRDGTRPSPATRRTLTSAISAAPRATILVFSANGAASRRDLQLGREQRAIKNAVAASRLWDRYHLVLSPVASFVDVVRDLDTHQPAFVHFACHGGHESGDLILDGEQEGYESLVSPEQIATLLGNLRNPPTLVTFTACFSKALAEAAATHASYAIGFGREVRDATALIFSASLYERLTSYAHPDVPRAFEMAKLICESKGGGSSADPSLYVVPGSRQLDTPPPPTKVIARPRAEDSTLTPRMARSVGARLDVESESSRRSEWRETVATALEDVERGRLDLAKDRLLALLQDNLHEEVRG